MATDDALIKAINFNTEVVRTAEEKRKADAEKSLLDNAAANKKLIDENIKARNELKDLKENTKFGGYKDAMNKLANLEEKGIKKSTKEYKAAKAKVEGFEQSIKEKQAAIDETVIKIDEGAQAIKKEKIEFSEFKEKGEGKMEIEGIERLIALEEERTKADGKTRADEKKMLALEKKKFQLELQQASPQERAEMLKDQAAKDSQMLTTMQAIGQRIRGNEVKKDKGDSIFTGPLKFLKGILLKGALLAFIMFLPKILDSQFMRDAIDFMQDKVIPGIKSFFEDAIKPLGKFFIEDILPPLMKIGAFLFDEVLPIISVYIVAQIETLKNLFSDLSAAFDKIMSGDILGGISDLILGIGTFVMGLADNLVTAVFNIIAKIFGLEGTDSVFSSISGFFTGIYDYVAEKITAVLDYLKGIFGFDGEGFGFDNLIDLAFVGINLAINFIKDIFGFGNPDEPFRMSEFLAGIFTKIGDFFRNLFDIDIRALASKFLPKTAVDFLLGKDETEAENLAAAQEGGLYTKETFGITGNKLSGVDTSRIPFAPEGQLKAILADDDISDENRQMIEKELQKRKLQKDLQKGNLGVPEQINDFGGTDRAIREAAEREAASTNIVAPDQRVVSNSSTTVVQNETITPSYSGYGMVSTESDYN